MIIENLETASQYIDSDIFSSIGHLNENENDPWGYLSAYLAQPVIGLQVKGPNNWKTTWLAEFQRLIMEFICMDKEEDKADKEMLISNGKVSADKLITFLAGIIAAKLGFSVAAVIGLVAIVIYLIAKKGLQASCVAFLSTRIPN